MKLVVIVFVLTSVWNYCYANRNSNGISSISNPTVLSSQLTNNDVIDNNVIDNNVNSKEIQQLYYRIPYGNTYGPFPSLQIYQWWEQGQLDNDTLLSVDGHDGGHWIRVDSYFKPNHLETHSHVYIPNENNSNQIIDRQVLKQLDETISDTNVDSSRLHGDKTNIDTYNQQYQYQNSGYNQYNTQYHSQYSQIQGYDPNQNSHQYNEQGQYPNQYPKQYLSQYPNNPHRHPNEYHNQYPNQYGVDGRISAFSKLESLKERALLLKKRTSTLLGSLKEKVMLTAISTTDRMLKHKSSTIVTNDVKENSTPSHSLSDEWNTEDNYFKQDGFSAKDNAWDYHAANIDNKETDQWDTDEAMPNGDNDGFLQKVTLPSIPIPSFSSFKGSTYNYDLNGNINYDLNVNCDANDANTKSTSSYGSSSSSSSVDNNNKDFKISVKSLGVSDGDWLDSKTDNFVSHHQPKVLSSIVGTLLYPSSFLLPFIAKLNYINLVSIFPMVFPDLTLYFILLVAKETLKPITIMLGISFFKYITSNEVAKLNQFIVFNEVSSNGYIKIDPIHESTVMKSIFKHFPIGKIQHKLRQMSSLSMNFRDIVLVNKVGLPFTIAIISYVLIWSILVPALSHSASKKLDANESSTVSTSSTQWDFLSTSVDMMSSFGWILSISLLPMLMKDAFTFNTKLLFIATSLLAMVEIYSIKEDHSVQGLSSNKCFDSKSYAAYLENVPSSSTVKDIKRWGLFNYVNSIKPKVSQSRTSTLVNVSNNGGVVRMLRQSLSTLSLGVLTVIAIIRNDNFMEKVYSAATLRVSKRILSFMTNVINDSWNISNSKFLSLVVVLAPMYLWLELLSKSNNNRKATGLVEGMISSRMKRNKVR